MHTVAITRNLKKKGCLEKNLWDFKLKLLNFFLKTVIVLNCAIKIQWKNMEIIENGYLEWNLRSTPL